MDVPDTWTCKTIDGCESWPRATELIWHQIPDDKFVAFYEASNCHAGGKFSFISSQASGHHFMGFSPKVIRSIMVGERKNLEHGPSTTSTFCTKESANAQVLNETDGSATNDTEWGLIVGEGLSSNWSADLPGSTSN